MLERILDNSFVVSFKKFRNYVLFYQEPKPALDKKIPGAGAAPKQAGSETLQSDGTKAIIFSLRESAPAQE